MARLGDVLMVWCAVFTNHCLMNVLTAAEEPVVVRVEQYEEQLSNPGEDSRASDWASHQWDGLQTVNDNDDVLAGEETRVKKPFGGLLNLDRHADPFNKDKGKILGKRPFGPLYDNKRSRTFSFGKRQDGRADETSEDANFSKRRLVKFGKRPFGGNVHRWGLNFGDDLLSDKTPSNRHDKRKFMFGKRTDEEKRKFMFGKRDDDDDDDDDDEDIEDEKRRIMFGKRTEEEKRRFMFGKREDGDEEKRKIMFGKRDDDVDEEDKRRFMFGKRQPDGEEDKRRFMFGKRQNGDEGKRRFMFGKRDDDDGQETDEGKRRFMFGKRENAAEEAKRRFMFGKRQNGEVQARKFMFGKRINEDDVVKRKFMFGKREDGEMEKKKFMFGKRLSDVDQIHDYRAN